MLTLNICKNLCRTHKLRSLGGSLMNLSTGSKASESDKTKRNTSQKFGKTNLLSQCRFYSTDGTESRVTLPPISDNPVVLWPSIFKTLHNFYLNLVILREWDSEFNMTEFLEASKQALRVVSNALANENYDQLEELVVPDVLEKIKQKISHLSYEQKQLIAVRDEDVCMSFPFDINLITKGEKGQERYYIEILVIFHILKGLANTKDWNSVSNLKMSDAPQYQGKLFVANYRFIREYVNDVETSWVLNMINHFTPDETIQ